MLSAETVRSLLSTAPPPEGASSASEKKFADCIAGILFLSAHMNHNRINPDQAAPSIATELKKQAEFLRVMGKDNGWIERVVHETLHEAHRKTLRCLANPQTHASTGYKLTVLQVAADRGYSLETFGGSSKPTTRTRG